MTPPSISPVLGFTVAKIGESWADTMAALHSVAATS